MSSARGPTIQTGGSGLPSRLVFHGVEGIGKTTLGAFAPKPVFVMTRGETGLLTLIDNGLVPATVAHFGESQTWPALYEAVSHLCGNDTGHRTLVIDTLNGAERLCFEHVCKEKFGGDWEKFGAYGKGPETSLEEWLKLLSRLDALRRERKMAVIALTHTRIKTFKNPEGNDFDRYSPDMNEKTWGLAARWADVILFGNFKVHAKKEFGAMKAKGFGGQERILYTQRTAAYDAKNRLSLPDEIGMGSGPADAWANLYAEMRKARANGPGNGGPGQGGAPTATAAPVAIQSTAEQS